MTLYYKNDRATLLHGDCVAVMRQLPDNSVDSIVTDPPYGLEFMGKEWDAPWKNSGDVLTDPASVGGFQDGAGGNPYSRSRIRYGRDGDAMLGFQDWFTVVAIEALRVLKPGGHLLAFGGTRTWHRLASAIEDAGFEVRDSIAWMYGSGFPKSHDVSKAIDKARRDQRDWQKVGKWLKSKRVGAGFSRQSIAPLLSAHKNLESAAANMSNWENGLSLPTWDRWLELKNLIGFGDDMDAEVWRLNGRKGQPGKAWAEREVVGTKSVNGEHGTAGGYANGIASHNFDIAVTREIDITAPATPAAQQWQGWGTALKPAFEPIVVARKPLIGTVAENVLKHGTGALNIDGCRIGTDVLPAQVSGDKLLMGGLAQQSGNGGVITAERVGRWPANVILDESQAAELDKQSGKLASPAPYLKSKAGWLPPGQSHEANELQSREYGDTGGASRFFYCAKAGKKERPNVDGVAHPTVKPLKLMEYLCRLVTPPGGTILEPFAGSGTTIEAALNEGFNVIGIEMTDEYLPLIMTRIERHGEKLC